MKLEIKVKAGCFTGAAIHYWYRHVVVVVVILMVAVRWLPAFFGSIPQ